MPETNKMTPWLNVAALACSQLGLLLAIVIYLWVFPEGMHFLTEPLGAVLLSVASGLSAFLVTVCLGRPKSLRSFANNLDLNLKINRFSFISVIFGICFGVVGIFLTRFNIVTVSGKEYLEQVFHSGYEIRGYLFLLFLVVFPVIEEIVLRGFIYRSFRKIYSVSFSVITNLVLVFLAHSSVMLSSVWAFLLLALLQITLCLLYEKSRVLWNSIFCHISYNAILGIYDITSVRF